MKPKCWSWSDLHHDCIEDIYTPLLLAQLTSFAVRHAVWLYSPHQTTEMQRNGFSWAIFLIQCAMWEIKLSSADFHKLNQNNRGLTKSFQRPGYDSNNQNTFIHCEALCGKCGDRVLVFILRSVEAAWHQRMSSRLFETLFSKLWFQQML